MGFFIPAVCRNTTVTNAPAAIPWDPKRHQYRLGPYQVFPASPRFRRAACQSFDQCPCRVRTPWIKSTPMGFATTVRREVEPSDSGHHVVVIVTSLGADGGGELDVVLKSILMTSLPVRLQDIEVIGRASVHEFYGPLGHRLGVFGIASTLTSMTRSGAVWACASCDPKPQTLRRCRRPARRQS